MAKVAPETRASLTTKVPAPAKQGGHGSSDAVTQGASIQKKLGPIGTGKSDVKYSLDPSGTRGTNPGCN